MNTNNEIPTFTPPESTPTFTPPKQTGNTCHYHPSEVAVAKCARCGKYICEDCYDNYGVSDGPYAGEALCYDCCRALVAQNIEDLTANKKKIKFYFILSIVGIVIGFILGLSTGIGAGEDIGTCFLIGFLYACIGGVFWSFVKYYFSTLWNAIKAGFATGGVEGIILGVVYFVIAIFIGVLKCIYYTIRNTIEYIIYLKKTTGFIESDSLALQQMKDYMEYTMIRNQNRGVDIETLIGQKSELADNSYARMVQEKGEEGAEAALRSCVATINENGEIIRSFNNRAA